jgi:signal transduction histidine kinase
MLERSRTTPGSGLGLSTVAAIVDLHRATIELLDNRLACGLRSGFRDSEQTLANCIELEIAAQARPAILPVIGTQVRANNRTGDQYDT